MAKTMMPTASRPITRGEVSPTSAAWLTSLTKQENPITDSKMDKKSILGLVSSLVFSSSKMAKSRAIPKKGIKSQKTHRQDKTPRIRPVIVGPIAGASMITMAQPPIAAPSFWGGKICMATVNISGRTMPVPTP